MKKRTTAAIGLLIIVAACATPSYNYVPRVEAFSSPPLGEVTAVSVGDEMLSQGVLKYQNGIEVPQNTKVSGYTLSGGFYAQTGQSEKASFHSFLAGTGAPNGYGTLTKGALMDPAQSIEAYYDENKLCVITVFNLHTCRDRDFQRTEKAIVSPDSFQQTLLYSGRVGDKISISYREFSGSVARPAFSNDVEYDLSESSEIAYKGARLEIVEATNTTITFRVLSNFR